MGAPGPPPVVADADVRVRRVVRPVVGANAGSDTSSGDRPVPENACLFGKSAATCVKFTPSVERSTLNPASFVALSVHARLIWLDETAVAVRFEGAAGVACVVAVAVFENAEWFGPSNARTR